MTPAVLLATISVAAHVADDFGGNITACAKHYGVSRGTVYRWVDAGALVIKGQIYPPATEVLTS